VKAFFTSLEKKKLVDLYEEMLKIRCFEDKTAEIRLRHDMTIPGTMDLSSGMEAVAVGVCANLRADDYITSTHRGHGHCLAKGAQMRELFAELMGKRTGYSRGRGGPYHICVPELGIICTTGIVGAGVPIASGVGLSIQCRGTDQVVACFIGEGATNTGAFHEGVNLAGVWKLPVLFVIENNLYGLSTHVSRSTSVKKDLAERAAAYGMPGVTADGMNLFEVYETARKAVEKARGGGGPTLLEYKTYRYWGSFVEEDDEYYRTKEEKEEWKKRDPIEALKKYIVENNILTSKDCEMIEQKVLRNVEESSKLAAADPNPSPDEVDITIFDKGRGPN
jgi:TPP-dependent pyruvate/acetoin dehydrogenase alpha subunit